MSHRHNKKKRKQEPPEDPNAPKPPKTMVIRRGKVGRSMKELEANFRELLLPHTALHLKERKSNNLKDFLAVAGPLGVTQLIALSSTELGSYIRFLKTPQVVMNNFGDAREMELCTTMFQKLFPVINVQKVNIAECRRVVLFHYDKEKQIFELRHYLITVAPTGVSKSVKRLLQSRIPSLGNLDDIADYVLNNAAASESDAEDASETHVELPDNYSGHAHAAAAQKSAQSAVRLQELGPRMTLHLHKIQEGFGDGEVIYHAHVRKSEEEVAALKERKEKEREEKKRRKAEQEQNYKRKRGLDDQAPEEGGEDGSAAEEGDSYGDESDDPKKRGTEGNENPEDEAEDDDEYYRLEVGEEPPSGLKPTLGRRPFKRGRGRGGSFGRGSFRGGFRGRGGSRGGGPFRGSFAGRGRGRGGSPRGRGSAH